MNRQEILETLSSFPYDPRGYWVITGSAMVLYGIREQTHDIDLGCTVSLADRLEADGFLYRRTSDGKRCFHCEQDIEVFEGWLADRVVMLDGIQVISIDGLMEMKRSLGREKDKRDIELILAWRGRTGETA